MPDPAILALTDELDTICAAESDALRRAVLRRDMGDQLGAADAFQEAQALSTRRDAVSRELRLRLHA